MSHLKVASIRTFSIDLASYQPLPEHGYTPVSSSRPVQWLKHNIPVPKNADRENFDSAPLTVQPKSRFCLSYSLPLVQPNTLAESKPIREHDRPSILLQLLRSLSAAQAPEELTSIPSEAAHRALSSDISESKPSGTCNPTWYGLSSHSVPFQASFSVNFERFTDRRLFLFSRKCQTLGVPRQSRGFT